MNITRHHWYWHRSRGSVGGAMRPMLLLLFLAACAHAPAAPSPTREVLATPAGITEARASWVASTVRLARTEVMRSWRRAPPGSPPPFASPGPR